MLGGKVWMRNLIKKRLPRRHRLFYGSLRAARSRTSLLQLEQLEDRCLLSYSVTDLGTLGGPISYAYGINNAGQVVGYAYSSVGFAVGYAHAFLYQNASMTDLGTFGGEWSQAYGINSAGQVVGYADTSANTANSGQAFLYQNGSMTDLGTLGGPESVAYGINNAGQVVGFATRSVAGSTSTYAQAFLYQNGSMTDLGTLGGSSSTAYGINDAGQVVGEAGTSGNTAVHAFLYQNGMMRDLGTLGGPTSNAYGINNAGQVVGDAYTSGNANHAFLYQNGMMTDLGTLGGSNSQANAINSAGMVVGNAETGAGAYHAFLYQNGSMTDLNSLIAGSGWTLYYATAINDNGQIVGQGINPSGQAHAFLLTPSNSTPINPNVTVTPTSLTWNARQGGVDFSYQISGGAAPTATTVELYWASGNQSTNVIGGPIAGASQVVAAGTAVGTYGPFHVDQATLGTPPTGATYLLAIADPQNLLGNFSQAQNVLALAVSALVPTGLAWDTAQGGVDVGHSVSGGPIPLATTVDLYWASSNQFTNVIGGPITGATQAVAAGTAAGSYGPFYVSQATLGTPPTAATYLLAVADPQNLLGNFSQAQSVQALAIPNILTPTGLAWDSSQEGVDVGYTVAGVRGTVSKDTTVDLYWASGNQFTNVIGGPITGASQDVAAGTSLGSYGPFYVDAATLGTPPSGATYLLAIADPQNLLGNFSQAQNVQALAILPEIVVDSVSTTDSRCLTVDYDIYYEDITTPLTIDFYRSSTPQFDPQNNIPLGEITDPNAAIGPHEDTIQLAGGLPPNTVMPYVLAVANQNSSIAETTTGNDTAFFRTYVIGAVSPGFDLSAWSAQPAIDTAWVQPMANALTTLDGYWAAIPFSWPSGSANPNAIINAGQTLYDDIMAVATAIPNLQPNDVIDVHLIGHSRGAVVISEAMQSLIKYAGVLPQLDHGYFKMTLLDPHPANTAYGLNASLASPLPFPASIAQLAGWAAYWAFEEYVQDPPVVIPARVNEVDDLYQKTNSYPLLSSQYPVEDTAFNLQGLAPSDITIDDPAVTQVIAIDLTSPGMGHSEVHDWYMNTVVLSKDLASNAPILFAPPSPPPSEPDPSTSGLLSGMLVSSLGPNLLDFYLNSSSTLTLLVTTNTDLQTVISAINGLSPRSTPATIIITLSAGQFSDINAQPPAGVTVLVVGNGPTSTIVGQSPALTVASGAVLIEGSTLTTATAAPTILNSGGSLILRDDTIQESTGGNEPAIDLTSGTLDLGTTDSPGDNVIDVTASGEPLQNTTTNLVPAFGDTIATNGSTLPPSFSSFTSLGSSLVSSFFDQNVTLTATVTPGAAGWAAPTGSVDFYDNTTKTDLGSTTLSGSVASLTTSMLSVGNQAIVATYSGDSNYLTSTASLTQTVNPVFATHFAITAPATAPAGTAFIITITALDQINNTAASYRGTVHFTSSDSQAVLPGNVTLSNGVGTFSFTLKTAGTQTLTATDTSSSSISGNTPIIVGTPAANHFVVGTPSLATPGKPFSFTVTAQNDLYNTATSYTGTVLFVSSDTSAVLPADETLTNGTGTFTATLQSAGSQTITAYDTGASTITGRSGQITVSAGATHFLVSTPTNTAAGGAFIITVTALDKINNVVAGYGGTVHLSSSDRQAVLASNTTLTNGVGVFAAVLRTAGNQTITATDIASTSIAGASATVTVAGLAASQFVVVAQAKAITGTAFSITVTAEDQFGNTAAGYNGTVHFTSSDGSAILPPNSTLTGGMAVLSATLKDPGTQTISANDVTTISIAGTSNNIATLGLVVTSLTPTSTGFVAVFNKPFDPTTINLYDTAGTLGPDDVLLTGPGTLQTSIHGSLIIDPTDTTITFVKTSTFTNPINSFNPQTGVLAAGTYTVTFRSASNGFKDLLGATLDGTASGNPAGSNYVTTFVVATTPAVVVGVPGFARGPGNTVNLPNNATGVGLPISISNGTGVTSGKFTLQYNTALLSIAGATVNSGLTGATLTLEASSTPGNAVIDFSSTTALPSGPDRLGGLVATVPNSAAALYKSKALLHFSSVLVNGSSATGDDAVDVDAYFGDANGDGVLSGGDAALIARVASTIGSNAATGTIAGFSAFPLADPVLIGDLSSSGSVNSASVTLMNSYLAGSSRAQIPPIPTGLTIATTGPDPSLSLGRADSRLLYATPGGTVIVPVNIDTARPSGSTGMTEAILAVKFDPAEFTVSTQDVELGTLLMSGSGWQLEMAINSQTGEIGIDLFSSIPIQTTASGTLVTIAFHVRDNAPAGSTGFTLMNAVNPTGQRAYATEVSDAEGAFILHQVGTVVQIEPEDLSQWAVENRPDVTKIEVNALSPNSLSLAPTGSRLLSTDIDQAFGVINQAPITDRIFAEPCLLLGPALSSVSFGTASHLALFAPDVLDSSDYLCNDYVAYLGNTASHADLLAEFGLLDSVVPWLQELDSLSPYELFAIETNKSY